MHPATSRAKRTLDVACAALALAVLGVPLAVVALVVRLRMGAPVLFRQVRPGSPRLPARIPFTSMTVISPTRPAAPPVVPDSGVLAWYDALDEDPPGHRLEVLEEHLLVSPSPVSEHQDRARGLAEALDEGLRDTRWEVREDLEWPIEHPVLGLGSRLRPDASVLDPEAPEDAPRLVTAEVLSPSDHERLVAGEPETRIEGKRRVYAYGGVTLHLEVELVDEQVEVRAYVNRDGTLELTVTARGDEPLVLDGPVPLELVPAELEGWLRRRLADQEAALDQVRQEREAALARLTEEHEAALERVRQEREAALARLTEEHEAALERLTEERARADAAEERAARAEAAARRTSDDPS